MLHVSVIPESYFIWSELAPVAATRSKITQWCNAGGITLPLFILRSPYAYTSSYWTRESLKGYKCGNALLVLSFAQTRPYKEVFYIALFLYILKREAFGFRWLLWRQNLNLAKLESGHNPLNRVEQSLYNVEYLVPKSCTCINASILQDLNLRV